jgi:hypothetical protein
MEERGASIRFLPYGGRKRSTLRLMNALTLQTGLQLDQSSAGKLMQQRMRAGFRLETPRARVRQCEVPRGSPRAFGKEGPEREWNAPCRGELPLRETTRLRPESGSSAARASFLPPSCFAALKIYASRYAQKWPQFKPVAPCLVMFFTDRRNETD